LSKEERLTLRQSALIGLLVSGYNQQADEIDELKELLKSIITGVK
jgi:hypothetical protein